jgi:hypothetical protein
MLESAVRASDVPAAWTILEIVSRLSPKTRAASRLLFPSTNTVELLRRSPLQTSPAAPPNQSAERFSPKVAGFYSASSRTMPPVRGLILLRRLQPEMVHPAPNGLVGDHDAAFRQ